MKAIYGAIMIAAGLVGCKDEKERLAPSAPEGQMTASLDLAFWSSENPIGYRTGGTLSIIAPASDGSKLRIELSTDAVARHSIPGKTGANVIAHTVTYSPSLGSADFRTSETPGATAGEVNITEIDETNMTVSGFFQATTTELSTAARHEITSGAFNKIPYDIWIAGLPTYKATGSASAKINNVLSVSPRLYSATQNGNTILIFAYGSDQRFLSLYFPNNLGPGTYTLGGSNTQYYGVWRTGGVGLVSTTGVLTLTSHNATAHRIEGTFQFTAASPGTPNVEINEGSFSLDPYK